MICQVIKLIIIKTDYRITNFDATGMPEGYFNHLRKEQWVNLCNFVKAVGGKLKISVANCDGLHSHDEPWNPSEAEKILTMKVALRDGTNYLYEFYGMTARKAYYSLNGSGQFYINRDYVKQIISACTGVLNGDEVVVDRKN